MTSRRNSLSSTSSFQSQQSQLIRDISTNSLLVIDDKFRKKSINSIKSQTANNQAYYFPNGEVFHPRLNNHQKRARPDKIRPDAPIPPNHPRSLNSSLRTRSYNSISQQCLPNPQYANTFNSSKRAGSLESMEMLRSMNDVKANANNFYLTGSKYPSNLSKSDLLKLSVDVNVAQSKTSTPSPLSSSSIKSFPRINSTPNFSSYKYGMSNSKLSLSRNSSSNNLSFNDSNSSSKQAFLHSVRNGSVLNIAELNNRNYAATPGYQPGASPKPKLYSNNLMKPQSAIERPNNNKNLSLQSLPEKGSSSISSTSSGYSLSSSTSEVQMDKPQTGAISRSLSNTPTTSISTNDTKEKDLSNQENKLDNIIEKLDQYGASNIPQQGQPELHGREQINNIDASDFASDSQVSSENTEKTISSDHDTVIETKESRGELRIIPETEADKTLDPNSRSAFPADSDKISDTTAENKVDDNNVMPDSNDLVTLTDKKISDLSNQETAVRTIDSIAGQQSSNNEKTVVKPVSVQGSNPLITPEFHTEEKNLSLLPTATSLPSTPVPSPKKFVKTAKSMPKIGEYHTTKENEISATTKKSKFKAFFKKLFSKKPGKLSKNASKNAKVEQNIGGTESLQYGQVGRTELQEENKATAMPQNKLVSEPSEFSNQKDRSSLRFSQVKNGQFLTLPNLPDINMSDTLKAMSDLTDSYDNGEEDMSKEYLSIEGYNSGSASFTSNGTRHNRNDIFLKDDELSAAQIQDQKLKDSTFQGWTNSSSSDDEYVEENSRFLQQEYNFGDPTGFSDLHLESFNNAYDSDDDCDPGAADKLAGSKQLYSLNKNENSETLVLNQEQLNKVFNEMSLEERSMLPGEIKYIRQFRDFKTVKIEYQKFEDLVGDKSTNDSVSGSILKANPNETSKQVKFSNNLYISETFAPDMYKRYNKCVTQYTLTEPSEIYKIKMELNDFKSNEMLIHEQSQRNTHFFYR